MFCSESRRNARAASFYPQYERTRTWWFSNRGKSSPIEAPFFCFVKRAARRSLNRMWRHILVDDPDTKFSGVFCRAPVYYMHHHCHLATKDDQTMLQREVLIFKHEEQTIVTVLIFCLLYWQVLNELDVLVLIPQVSWEDVNMQLACYFGARMRKTYVILKLCFSFCSFSSLLLRWRT